MTPGFASSNASIIALIAVPWESSCVGIQTESELLDPPPPPEPFPSPPEHAASPATSAAAAAAAPTIRVFLLVIMCTFASLILGKSPVGLPVSGRLEPDWSGTWCGRARRSDARQASACQRQNSPSLRKKSSNMSRTSTWV